MVNNPRLLLGLLVGNLVVTTLLVVWVVSVASGNQAWLPAALNPTAAVREDLDDALAAVDSAEYDLSYTRRAADEALSLADEAEVSASDARIAAEDAQATADDALYQADELCGLVQQLNFELDLAVNNC